MFVLEFLESLLSQQQMAGKSIAVQIGQNRERAWRMCTEPWPHQVPLHPDLLRYDFLV
jgi:hypothetical protein